MTPSTSPADPNAEDSAPPPSRDSDPLVADVDVYEMPDPLRVLLIEDDDDHAALVEAYLADACSPTFDLARVATVEAAATAFGQTRATGALFHAVLADQQLPDSAYGETVARVVVEASGAPVVALTSLGDPELAVQAIRAGANDYLVKSELTPELLRRTLLYAVERARRDAALRATEEALRQALRHVRQVQARIAGRALAGGGSWNQAPEASRLRALADDLTASGSVSAASVCRALADEVGGAPQTRP